MINFRLGYSRRLRIEIAIGLIILAHTQSIGLSSGFVDLVIVI